ncbi:MAG: K(+)-transporting ATPase subunit F [Magnetococcales bacterium]|nr:K(+)-transporting ATPase subunit F [Magnetococcales bacterium]
MNPLYLIGLVVTAAVFVYLVVVLFKPEQFS